MTAQSSDRLQNQRQTIDLGELMLYGIVTGDVTTNRGWGEPYVFQTKPSVPPGEICSALWRGYVAEFEIRHDGMLELKSYDYPLAHEPNKTAVNEVLEGDFWLVMKSDFAGPRVYIPFIAGKVVDEESRWLIPAGLDLHALKHPVRPKRAEPKNVPLAASVFVGKIERYFTDKNMKEWVWIVVDRDLPRKNFWCRLRVTRSDRAVAESRVGGNRGGARGPWLLSEIQISELAVGDELWATEELPD